MKKLIGLNFEFFTDESEDIATKLTGEVIGYYKTTLGGMKVILTQKGKDLVYVVPVSKLHKKVRILNTNRP
ncbi:hypothetical protein [Flavobacterium sp. J27]|uniref:hypothetical protein n=1 Tax=Flavobacterium sp. J27 TaxID=2060419 RepID=UPI00102F3069|nr:hypothetical protein [Flavobacterium sp. J27]